jgi:hypothetical protein
MDEQELLIEIEKAQGIFSKNRYPKFSGTITVELFKYALSLKRIVTSPRDVFIRGLPLEIDLLIARAGTIPKYSLLYEPEDVLMAFEIKNAGSFGDKTINTIKNNYHKIMKCNPKISCIYVTIHERDNFRWRITEENTDFLPYTLFWYSSSGKNKKSSGDWNKLIDKINDNLRDNAQ